jgi:tetratricopeptide (TPR) repeat protein
MKYDKNIEELFSKIHQTCCTEYENSIKSGNRKRSLSFLMPIVKVLADFNYPDSLNLYAGLIFEEDPSNFNEVKEFYLKAIDQGSSAAIYNLYISYAEIGDVVNALKYYKMARDSNEVDFEEEFLKYDD